MATRGQDLPTPQAHTRPHMAGDSVTHTLPIPGAAPPPPSGGGAGAPRPIRPTDTSASLEKPGGLGVAQT